MEHDYPFERWYASQSVFYQMASISSSDFAEFPFPDGINTGDIIVLRGADPATSR